MTELLQIAEAYDSGMHVLLLRGELDLATARLLDARLRALLECNEQLELDLSELSFIDSSGLAVLLAAARAADRDGGTLAIRKVSASVMRVIEISGLAAELPLRPQQLTGDQQ